LARLEKVAGDRVRFKKIIKAPELSPLGPVSPAGDFAVDFVLIKGSPGWPGR